jgi:hypothetical protein
VLYLQAAFEWKFHLLEGGEEMPRMLKEFTEPFINLWLDLLEAAEQAIRELWG